MIGAMVSATAMRQIAALINSALRYDSASHYAIAELSGTRIVIDSHSPAFRVAVAIDDGRISLHTDPSEAADVTLSGSLVSIIAVALKAQRSMTLAGSGVTVSGDTQVLQQLNNVLGQLDIDWEAALADVLGDIPAHALGSAVRAAARSFSENSRRLSETAIEVAQEEWRITPSMPEFEELSAQIRLLAGDVERLEARVARLLERLPK